MRPRNAFNSSVFEASKLVWTKTLLLKHYYRRQGKTPTRTPSKKVVVPHLLGTIATRDPHEFFGGDFGVKKGSQMLRSRPPFTGVLLGPGPESAPRSAFWAILGTCLGVPQRQKALKKHSLGHSEAGAQNCPKSTPGGTFRPGP